MFDSISRRGFVGLATVAGAMLATRASWARQAGAPAYPVGDAFPTTDAALAQEMVGVCHANPVRVRELLAEDRGLCLAAWDWGFGDWETALGACSHTGHKEIAETLLAHGARADLFTLTMLDRVDAVRAVCQAMPGIQQVRGPHGITLMSHARAGDAARTEEYLTALGGADIPETDLPIDDAAAALLLGRYASSDARFEVGKSRMGGLEITREGGTPRRLSRARDMTFTPAGAPQVEITFVVENDRASALAITRGRELLRARRVEA